MNSFCIIIPTYNHYQKLAKLINDINIISEKTSINLPIILIDDASNDLCKKELNNIKNSNNNIHLFTNQINMGKGGAVKKGILEAKKLGFTHTIQIDADYQHDINDIPKFIKASNKNPNSLICGVPIYDESVPKGRLYPRYITHFWVWVNTLSFMIKDSMCGYRIYPVEQTSKLINSINIGNRMDFDIDIIVNLYWKGMNIINIKTKVIYPEDGISQFNAVKDNILISKVHTKLFFKMLPQIPKLISFKFKRGSK